MKARRRISSGDKLTDWLFRRITQILSRKGTDIELVRTLTETAGGKKKHLYGTVDYRGYDPDTNEISINGRYGGNKRPEGRGKTLLHELAHILMRQVSEPRIYELESLL